MSSKNDKLLYGQKVEQAVCELDGLSTLSCVGAKYLEILLNPKASAAELSEIIACEPVLTFKILSLLEKEGVNLVAENFSLKQALSKISDSCIKEALFSLSIREAADSPEIEGFYKNLVMHSLSVACGARLIANLIEPRMNSNLAYLAGLLSNLGKYALLEAMPKSMLAIVEETERLKANDCRIESEHLGVDYRIIGKRLAHKLRLPNQLSLAIWLGRSESTELAARIPETRIAQIVQLTYKIARKAGIGSSYSFEQTDGGEAIAQSLSISPERLEEIRNRLLEEVKENAKTLGFDIVNPDDEYKRILRKCAFNFGRDNLRLSKENQSLQADKSKFDFINDFATILNSENTTIEVAERLGKTWQKFYQTGKVCVFLVGKLWFDSIPAVVVERQDASRTFFVKVPDGQSAIPAAISKNFDILDCGDQLDWLLSQIDIPFDTAKTKLLPLLSNSFSRGVLLFESRYPADMKQIRDNMLSASRLACKAIEVAKGFEKQQRYSEEFAEMLSAPPQGVRQAVVEAAKPIIEAEKKQEPAGLGRLIDALAELSAGAAHELNNPCSVVAGRAQLLAASEEKPERKNILEQIYQNTQQISRIISDLMDFAQPQQPRSTFTDTKQVLNEAIELAMQKTGLENIDIIPSGYGQIYADSAQIVSALANIITNALESYPDNTGPVEAIAAADGDYMRFDIKDHGYGMDAETAVKAAYPFFSNKPAGRKRGMGLSYAYRFVELNKGKIAIESNLHKGTTVKVWVPRIAKPAKLD